MTILIYTVAMFGIAYVVGHSTISLPFRRWIGGIPAQFQADALELKQTKPPVPGALGPFGDALCALIECPACLGFWLGLISGAFLVKPMDGFEAFNWVMLLAFYTSGSNFILARLTRLS